MKAQKKKQQQQHQQQKKLGQCAAILTEKIWSIKDLLHGQNIIPKIFAGTKPAMPSGQDS